MMVICKPTSFSAGGQPLGWPPAFYVPPLFSIVQDARARPRHFPDGGSEFPDDVCFVILQQYLFNKLPGDQLLFRR